MDTTKKKPNGNAGLEIPRMIGYMRVSTNEQRMDLQREALLRAGVLLDNLFEDTASGASRTRPGLRLAMMDAREGDTFIVWKLDRLARSVAELVKIAEEFDQQGIKFRSLTEAIDTSTAMGRFFYHSLGAFAQFERDLNKERTRAGMRAAKERGSLVGAPKRITPEMIMTARRLIIADPVGGYRVAAKKLRIGRSTLAVALPGGVSAVLAWSKRTRKRI